MLQNFYRKRIKKIHSVRLIRDNEFCRIHFFKRYPSGRNCCLFIFLCIFIDSLIIFNPDRLTSGLPGQKEIHPPFSAAIIQQQIVLSDIPGIRKALQYSIWCWLIGISVLIRVRIIPSTGADMKQLVLALFGFVFFHMVTPAFVCENSMPAFILSIESFT